MKKTSRETSPGNDDIKIVFLTDMHTGHPKVSTEHMFNCYLKYVVPELDDADMLIVGGDMFDDLVTLDGRDGMFLVDFIHEIRYVAIDRGIPVRILRGTFTHDRKQGAVFDTELLAERYGRVPDLRVVDTVSVEHHDKLGLDLLYIPDDIIHDNFNETVNKVLKSNHMNRVDVAVHHGYCQHMVPPEAPIDREMIPSADDFKRITRYVALNGHVHTPSTKGVVVNGGSFDRLAHGEEEPKGFFVVTLHRDSNETSAKFIENKDAIQFVTADLTDCEDDVEVARKKAISVADEAVEKASGERVYLRIITDDLEVRQSVRRHCHMRYDNVHVSTQRSKVRRQTEHKMVFKELDLPKITRINLVDILYDELEGVLSKADIAGALKGE